MTKPLSDVLPKPTPPIELENRPGSGGATTPTPQRIKEAVREANDPNRLVSVPPENNCSRFGFGFGHRAVKACP
jgi:hypothetical protein